MRTLRVLLIAACASVVMSSAAFGQSVQCTESLSRAQARFDLGNLPGITEILLPCIRSNGFSKEENIRALALMTLVYLYQDDQANADLWMIELLKADPEHKFDPAVDPQEIIFLKEKFRYKPIYRLTGQVNGNLAFYRQLSEHGAEQRATSTVETSSPFGLGGNLLIEREFFPGLELGSGLGLALKNLLITKSKNQGGNLATHTERYTFFELPVFARYTYYGKKDNPWNPYVIGGASFGYLGKMEYADSERKSIDFSDDEAGATLPTQDFLSEYQKRTRFNYFAFAGLGVKKRVKTDFVIIEARYTYGVNNIVVGENRYAGPQELFFELMEVDSDFALNGLSFSIGYQMSIYKPKKISN